MITVARGPATAAAVHLVTEAGSSLAHRRGGAALRDDVASVLGVLEVADWAATLASREGLWLATDGDELVGVAGVIATPRPTILGVFVAPSARLRGVGRQLVATVRGEFGPTTDAWALPGDRATKRLYESTGMRARRLTMNGE